MPQTWILPRSSGLAVLGSQVYKEHSLWQNRANRSPATNWDLRRPRILAANLYAATSIRNVIWGVIEPWLQCASRAPGVHPNGRRVGSNLQKFGKSTPP